MSESIVEIPVELPNGVTTVSGAWGPVTDASAVLAVTHGAGGTFAQPFLLGFTAALRDLGVSTLRFNFPYSEQGRRMPGPASHAVATWRAVEAWVSVEAAGLPFFASGKSYGGRMASMAAADTAIAPSGLVYLGYPMHPPGEPTKLRVEHLPAIAPPQLFVEGTVDPFVVPHEQLVAAVASCRQAELVWVEGGGHSFEVKGRKRPADEIGAELAAIVAQWLPARL